MRSPLLFAALLAVQVASWGPASAQAQPDSADPIGDVLSGIAAQQGMDDDAAEAPDAAAASQANAENADGDAEDPGEPALPDPGPTSRYNAPAPAAPYGAPPAGPRLPLLDRPVMIDELYRSPEAPPTAVEQAYESRIRGGFNAAQGLQGPLDGGWVLRGADGKSLYGLQLVDKGAGAIMLEGAWRTMRPGPGQVGLVDTIERTATGGVYIRFTLRGARDPSILQLDPAGPEWRGTLWEAGDTRPVTLRRK